MPDLAREVSEEIEGCCEAAGGASGSGGRQPSTGPLGRAECQAAEVRRAP